MAHIDVVAHRVLHPLNWSHAPGQPVDGDVRKTTVAGEKVYFLRSQPRGQRPISGVSLFTPSAEFGPAVHGNLGSEAVGCAVTVPGTLLPAGLGIVHDGPLKLRLHGTDQPSVECGQHYTVYATADITAADFEVLFHQLMSTCLPCSMQGQAEPAFAVDDDDGWPGDPLVCACVMALDELAATTENPNTRLFAKLFAVHLQAVDPGFEEVLRIGPLADMAAAALSSYTVRDPFLLTHACDARDRLADTLGYTLPAPAYEPHWVAHPFNFLSGVYTDELYEEEVKTCAQRFVGDQALKALVRQAATQLFAQLAASATTVDIKSSSFHYHGNTFTVNCSRQTPGACDASGSSGSHGSGGSKGSHGSSASGLHTTLLEHQS